MVSCGIVAVVSIGEEKVDNDSSDVSILRSWPYAAALTKTKSNKLTVNKNEGRKKFRSTNYKIMSHEVYRIPFFSFLKSKPDGIFYSYEIRLGQAGDVCYEYEEPWTSFIYIGSRNW